MKLLSNFNQLNCMQVMKYVYNTKGKKSTEEVYGNWEFIFEFSKRNAF